MPIILLTTSSGRRVSLPGTDAPYLTAGDTVTLTAEGIPAGASVVLSDVAAKRHVPIGWLPNDKPVTYVVPASQAERIIRAKLQVKGQPPLDSDYRVAVRPHVPAKPDIGQPAADAEKPTEIPDKIEPAYLFGVCGATTVRPDLPVSSTLWEGTKPHSAVLAAIGCTGFREWDTTTGTPSIDDDTPVRWDRVQALVDAGVERVLITHACGKWREVGAKLPTIEGTQASARAFVKSIPPALKMIVAGQAGNEMFHENSTGEDYWPGTLEEYVRLFLNPYYDVLHEAGILVVLGGLNGGNPARDLRTIKELGGRFDYVGWHPYAENSAVYVKRRDELVAEAGDVPIIESESNTKDGPEHGKYLAWVAGGRKGKKQGRDAQSVAANQAAVDAERVKCPQIAERYEFSLEQQSRTMTGPLGWYVIRREKNVAVSAVTSELFDVRFAAKFKGAKQ